MNSGSLDIFTPSKINTLDKRIYCFSKVKPENQVTKYFKKLLMALIRSKPGVCFRTWFVSPNSTDYSNRGHQFMQKMQAYLRER